MQFFDKAINQVIKWESIDTSIPEMLNLIQTEILEKASSSDLRELEKGMHKTWVLGVGASLRYYPTAYSPVRLCFNFNIFTHQLQQISLQDTINKKEYFIPRGKESCTKLQRAVLRRIARLNYDEMGVSRKRGNGGKFLNQKKRPTISVFAVCGLVVIAVVIGASAILPSLGISTADTIVTVQNGYLGEYTDITVKEILDSYYGMLYENEEWDGGTTDSGAVLVQVRYYDSGMEDDATTIQFTMLNEDCFKITAFVDPLNPVEKATDLLAAMNYNYLLAYMGENRSVAGDTLAEKDFIARLGQISGSAVQYGASADYSGNRATICEIDGQTPLDASVTMLLDNYGLLDMNYYWGTDALDQATTEPYDIETTAPVTEPSEETDHDADTLLLAVLKGESTFIMSDTNESLTIYDVKKVGENEFDSPLTPIMLSMVDMDQDGQLEAIVELTNNANGWRVILRYQDGAIYGYGFNFRALQSISMEGLVMGSSGAAYSDVFRLHFDYNEVNEAYLSSLEAEAALENWIDASWYDYSEVYTGLDDTSESTEFYPLDYVSRNTGDVVNALGETFIYEDGFAGSKLFYYGNEPDIHYGFVPFDWSSPVLTGNESISIIILSGDALVSANLSADMNKTEIDAVAWDTPNVQNVSNGSSHDMMSGNVYRYEIETSSAIITYTWYLDNGDSIDYAASEIVIVPK